MSTNTSAVDTRSKFFALPSFHCITYVKNFGLGTRLGIHMQYTMLFINRLILTVVFEDYWDEPEQAPHSQNGIPRDLCMLRLQLSAIGQSGCIAACL